MMIVVIFNHFHGQTVNQSSQLTVFAPFCGSDQWINRLTLWRIGHSAEDDDGGGHDVNRLTKWRIG